MSISALTISCRSAGNVSISLQSRGATGGHSQQRRHATPRISGRWNTLSLGGNILPSASELNQIHNQPECSPARFPFLSKYTNFSKVKCHYQYISTKQPFAVSCYVMVYIFLDPIGSLDFTLLLSNVCVTNL